MRHAMHDAQASAGLAVCGRFVRERDVHGQSFLGSKLTIARVEGPLINRRVKRGMLITAVVFFRRELREAGPASPITQTRGPVSEIHHRLFHYRMTLRWHPSLGSPFASQPSLPVAVAKWPLLLERCNERCRSRSVFV